MGSSAHHSGEEITRKTLNCPHIPLALPSTISTAYLPVQPWTLPHRTPRIDDAGSAQETVTLSFGPVEIRNYGQGTAEIITTTPHPANRLIHETSSRASTP